MLLTYEEVGKIFLRNVGNVPMALQARSFQISPFVYFLSICACFVERRYQLLLNGSVWNTDGMTLRGVNRSTQKETCPSATSSTTNFARTGLRWISGHRGDKLATNRVALNMNFVLSYTKRPRPYRTVNTLRLTMHHELTIH